MLTELESLRAQLAKVQQLIDRIEQTVKEDLPQDANLESDIVFNKDGIPINSTYIGYSRKGDIPSILTVDENGSYYVNDKKFDSLSAAAEYVSGVRRSGWTFWRNITDNKTLKELFRR